MFEIREAAIAIEVSDLDVVRDTRRAELSSRRLDSSQVSGFKALVDLGRCCTAETFVRSIGVVRESAADHNFSILGMELWRQKSEENGFQREPESLQLGVGAVMFGRTESQRDAPGVDSFLESLRSELPTAISNEIARSSEAAESIFDKTDHGVRIGRSHPMKPCKPPSRAIRSAPGRSIR